MRSRQSPRSISRLKRSSEGGGVLFTASARIFSASLKSPAVYLAIASSYGAARRFDPSTNRMIAPRTACRCFTIAPERTAALLHFHIRSRHAVLDRDLRAFFQLAGHLRIFVAFQFPAIAGLVHGDQRVADVQHFAGDLVFLGRCAKEKPRDQHQTRD